MEESTSLFGETADFTPEEMGAAVPDSKQDEPPATEEKPAAEEKKEETAETETETTDDGKKEEKAGQADGDTEGAKEEKPSEEKVKKPPKGFVPLKAVHEAREKIDALRAELDTLKAEREAPKDEEFKVLSEEDFDKLLAEDIFEAMKYERKLRQYNEEMATKQAAEKAERDAISKAQARMLKAVPGLFDPEAKVNQDLAEFALTEGLDVDFLKAVTDPATKIIPRGGKSPILLGEQAAGFVEFLFGTYSKGSSEAERIAKAVAEAEVKTREAVTKEMMAKIKENAADHRSIGDLPGVSDKIKSGALLTEAELAALSEEEQRAYLGG